MLAEVVARSVGAPDSAAGGVLLRALHVLPGAAEGAILGAAQWWALRPTIAVSAKHFVGASAAAHAIFWVAQALVSYEPSAPPTMAILLFFGAFVGMVLGALLGLAQRAVLRPHVESTEGLVMATVVGWAAGMVVTAIAADLVPWGPFDLTVLAIEMAGGAVTGLVVGLTTAPVVGRFSPRV